MVGSVIMTKAEKYHLHGGCKTVGDRHVVTRTTLSREPKAKVVFLAKNDFRLERPQNVTKYTCEATSPHGGLHGG